MARRPLRICRPGRLPYEEALVLQKATERAVQAGVQPDTLILVEHPHTLTLGRGATRSAVIASQEILESNGVTVFETNRGGKATYHGPGQLVGYPIISLKPDREDVHRYLRDLEEVLIRTIARFEIESFRIKGLTGVHTRQGKLAAIGVHIARWVTSHGFALNINTDLAFFNFIIACEGEPVTSMKRILQREVDLSAVGNAVIELFGEIFDMETEENRVRHRKGLPVRGLKKTPSRSTQMLSPKLIREASERIASRVRRTPVVTSRSFNEASGREVFFKCENLQRAGAFKIRGATNKILSLTRNEHSRGVVAFSSGNHAQAVALAASEAGTRAVIAMPTDAPKAKVNATRGYGAEIHFYNRQLDDREAFAAAIAEREGLTMVPPYDDYLIMAGQGTCALEFLEDVPDLDCLVTPCGGGGLFSGSSTIGKDINPNLRCFAVEAIGADDTLQSFRTHERVKIPPPTTIADGMRNQSPGRLTFPILLKNAEDVILVSDEQIIEAMKFLLFRMKLLAEPTGAAGPAAVLFGKIPRDLSRVGVIISGGNVDQQVLHQLLGPATGE